MTALPPPVSGSCYFASPAGDIALTTGDDVDASSWVVSPGLDFISCTQVMCL